jgi:hypothetical protein
MKTLYVRLNLKVTKKGISGEILTLHSLPIIKKFYASHPRTQVISIWLCEVFSEFHKRSRVGWILRWTCNCVCASVLRSPHC